MKLERNTGPIVALAGGIGAARFLDGLARVVDPARVVVIGNTGDDLELHGLHISPDLDTVTYTLAGLANPSQGWGIAGDAFECMAALERLGAETWFRLGDRDLATHIFRTRLLRDGRPLSEVSAVLCAALGVRSRVLPATDDRLRTRVRTAEAGWLDFQNYFVQRRALDTVCAVEFDGAADARPAPGVLECIREAAAIIVCPSNPIISIGPILAVQGIREALRETAAPVAAISPIVGGRALKGPADRMMAGLGLESSARQVATMYQDFLDVFVIDEADAALAADIDALGLRCVVTATIMDRPAKRDALARATMEALRL